jgi:hypothetical protein
MKNGKKLFIIPKIQIFRTADKGQYIESKTPEK